MILGERQGYPPEFKGKNRSRLFALLRELQEAKLISEATVLNANRHPVGVWQISDEARFEAGLPRRPDLADQAEDHASAPEA